MAFGSSITARLGLDTAGFKSGLNTAHSQLTGFGKTLAGVFGASLSIVGLEQFISKIVDYGDKIQDLSDRYGVNAEALQKLGNIAETQGSSLEGVAKGFNKLLINSSQAVGGNQEMIQSFAALGITLDDLRKLAPEEIMLKIGKSSMDAADLVKVLGKSALELRPTLAGLADGTLKYGKAIDALDIEKLDRAADILKFLLQEVLVRGATVVVASFDAIKVASENLIRLAQTMIGAWEGMFKGMEAAARFDLEGVKQAAKQLYETKIELSGLAKEEKKPKRRVFIQEEDTAAVKAARLHELQKLAERPSVFGVDVTNGQDWWAGEEARRELKRLKKGGSGEITDRDVRAPADRANSPALMDRANSMKEGIGSQPFRENPEVLATLIASHETLKGIEKKVTFKEGGG
jgi:hypothetical protein